VRFPNRAPRRSRQLRGRRRGEETFLELLAYLDEPAATGTPAHVAGIAYRACDGTITRTTPRRRRRKLDELPWPAWDMFPLEKYLDARLFFSMPFEGSQRPMVILATRGCPYTCKFCSNEQMWGTSFFMRDPCCVVDEMEHYVRTYRATDFHFQDLTPGDQCALGGTAVRRDHPPRSPDHVEDRLGHPLRGARSRAIGEDAALRVRRDPAGA
jgi:radical SAM superfamily enzyme YgiQ (UPF0313 family)